jgi:hypothetical protein
MTGPATNAASIITIWKTLGRTTAIIYLAAVAGCALLGGILLDFLVTSADINIAAHSHWMLPDFIKYASAIALLFVLGYSLLGKRKASHK